MPSFTKKPHFAVPEISIQTFRGLPYLDLAQMWWVRITIGTSEADGCVPLSVADTGCGMGTPFLKGHLSRPVHTTKKSGLGSGMFQARSIVEAHRGIIQVKTEPSSGTTSLVKLALKSQLT